MANYPILFSQTELIEGNGFIARVIVAGRALLSEDGPETWVEGVNPGGFSATGATFGEALATFGKEYRAVLFDIASEAASFPAFRQGVQSFFDETNQAALADWDEAVQEVRAGKVATDWLTRRPADSPLAIQVIEVRKPQAANNEEGDAAIAA